MFWSGDLNQGPENKNKSFVGDMKNFGKWILMWMTCRYVCKHRVWNICEAAVMVAGVGVEVINIVAGLMLIYSYEQNYD